jgi:hypothetical protein
MGDAATTARELLDKGFPTALCVGDLKAIFTPH